MAKYSGSSVPYILIDGYDVKGDTTEVSDILVESVLEPTHTLGDSWEEHTATGMKKAAFSQSGFYDDTTGTTAMLFTGGTSTLRNIVLGISPTKAVGMEGVYGAKFSRLLDRGKLHKYKVAYTVSGAVEELNTLSSPATAQTVDWDGTSLDNATSSAAGGTGHMQVTSFSGFSGFIGTIEHSPDNVAWATLITFANVTSAPNAQRVTVAGTVDRYVRFHGNVTGVGSITVQAGFYRG